MGRFEIVLGRLKIVVDRCGSLWVVVDHCGSLWIVVGRCGSLWVVPGFSNYGDELVSHPERLAILLRSRCFMLQKLA